MKIKELKPAAPTHKFNSLVSGTVFKFRGHLWLMTDEVSAVRLSDGFTSTFSDGVDVEIVNGTFVVE